MDKFLIRFLYSVIISYWVNLTYLITYTEPEMFLIANDGINQMFSTHKTLTSLVVLHHCCTL